MNIESKKNVIAAASIGLSLLGCLLSYFIKTGADSFAPGMAVTFAGFMISLLSVQTQGRNIPAKTAFLLSTAAVFVSALLGAMG